MSESLVDRIKAAFDEDERVARATESTVWEAKGIDRHGDAWVQDTTSWTAIAAFTEVYPEASINMNGDDAIHIARHDPARVLRQVAAMRKILDLHTPHADGSCQICLDLGGPDIDPLMQDWPCPTVLALAEALGIEADHE